MYFWSGFFRLVCNTLLLTTAPQTLDCRLDALSANYPRLHFRPFRAQTGSGCRFGAPQKNPIYLLHLSYYCRFSWKSKQSNWSIKNHLMSFRCKHQVKATWRFGFHPAPGAPPPFSPSAPSGLALQWPDSKEDIFYEFWVITRLN